MGDVYNPYNRRLRVPHDFKDQSVNRSRKTSIEVSTECPQSECEELPMSNQDLKRSRSMLETAATEIGEDLGLKYII